MIIRRLAILFIVCGWLAADDSFLSVPLTALQITEGAWPKAGDDAAEAEDWRHWSAMPAMQPFVVLVGAGEAYIASAAKGAANAQENGEQFNSLTLVKNEGVLVVRVLPGQGAIGTLYVPKPDWSGMAAIGFTVPASAAKPEAKDAFYRAKAIHYQRLIDQGIAGAAWFRRQAAEARKALGGPKGAGVEAPPRPERENEIDDTFELFSGGRALSENLQLDRVLPVAGEGPDAVPLSGIEGITVAAMDWEPLLKDKKPELDALAARIPADQHAVFFPSFSAMTELMDEIDAHGSALLHAIETRAEDGLSKQRYQRQLCLEMSLLARQFGPQVVSAVAMTGSDPYLRAGSDVAVLFTAKQPEVLLAFLAAKLAAARQADATVLEVKGAIGKLTYTGVVNPERSVCAYLASVDDTVVVTNSLYQLSALAAVVAGTVPGLAGVPEYRFFRARYAKAEPESALVVVPDAALRRWCSARWRIADSRRTRAAAVLSAIQADHVDELAKGGKLSAIDSAGLPVAGLGTLSWSAAGVRSSIYGTLGFMTPITELVIDQVSKGEADAYGRFRDNYQRNWRSFFDPIAARFVHRANGLGLDLTVMPLIAGTDYREFIEFIGQSAIKPGAGDPHAGAMVQWALAIDPASRPMRQAGAFAGTMAPGLKLDVFSWVGQSLAVYADADPVWEEMAAGDMQDYKWFQKNFHRLPVVLQIEVSQPLKLALFLTALRGFIEQTAPGMTHWESLTYNDQPYVKVSPTAEARKEVGAELEKAALYYASTPRALIITLNEDALKRALDRQAVVRKAKADNQEPPAPPWQWIGESVALHVDQGYLTLIRSYARVLEENLADAMRRRAWSNLPILNEWKHRFPDQDPVALHEKLWGVRLICPGGGAYVWNDQAQTMESTVFGHPGSPKEGGDLPGIITSLLSANFGLTFEDQGLRARVELERTADGKPVPAPLSAPKAAAKPDAKPAAKPAGKGEDKGEVVP